LNDALRARLPRLNLFLDIYADLPPEWQERVKRGLRAVGREVLGLRQESLDPPPPIP
jgi:hypothetical protein